MSYAEISRAVGLDETNARRLIRHAMTNRIFREPRDGFVAHTAASRVLLEDKMMVDWVGVCSAEFFQAAAHTVDALVKYGNSQEPAETGYSLAHCPDVPIFAHMGKDPVRAKRFGGAMISLTGGEGYEVDYLVNNYPWADIGEGVVVDVSFVQIVIDHMILTTNFDCTQVGGSYGFVCVALAKQFPKLRFVVQDLPKTVADGPSKIPPEFTDRIEFQAHDFYTEQPVKDADVYFFRWICHNQSDMYGVKMLRALIPALKPGARIVISDNCLPTPNTYDMWDEKITRYVSPNLYNESTTLNVRSKVFILSEKTLCSQSTAP